MGEGSGVREPQTVSSSSETAPSSELCAFTTGGSAAPSVELSPFTSAILEENVRGDAVQRCPRVHAGPRALASWHTGVTHADGSHDDSEIDTVERVEIIRDLRIGKFDVVMDKLAQLGSHLNAAGDKYNETIVSFVDGNGSLKRQIEMMEELGASKEKGKTKRATPVLIENPTSISREVKDV